MDLFYQPHNEESQVILSKLFYSIILLGNDLGLFINNKVYGGMGRNQRKAVELNIKKSFGFFVGLAYDSYNKIPLSLLLTNGELYGWTNSLYYVDVFKQHKFNYFMVLNDILSNICWVNNIKTTRTFNHGLMMHARIVSFG